MTKQVLDGMLECQWGRIINISSVNGQKGAFGQTNYAAAKSGVHGFTKALALEVARKKITVNTVSPGYLRTKMVMKISQEILESKILPEIPVGRLGEPDEVASLIAYLCSDEASFVTGTNIAINGGQHMFWNEATQRGRGKYRISENQFETYASMQLTKSNYLSWLKTPSEWQVTLNQLA